MHLHMSPQKLCLITGGNTGIGFEVARQLLQRGHEVIIACRDNSRAEAACKRLQAAASSSSSSAAPAVSSVHCDLASLTSVRSCAQQVVAKWPRLDVLVCNAATITAKPSVTADGFDTMYQVNHLGHFLLSHLLLPQLLKSDAGRVVVVGSQLYSKVPQELADPRFFHKLAAHQQQQGAAAAAAEALPNTTAMQRYSLTKLYNLWFTKHMTAVLPQLQDVAAASSSSSRSSIGRLVVNAVTPGFVPKTELSRYAGPLGRFAMQYVMAWAPFAVTVQEAASRVSALCDGEAEGSSSGALYSRRAVVCTPGPADDTAAAAALWQQSCQDAGIQHYLPQQ